MKAKAYHLAHTLKKKMLCTLGRCCVLLVDNYHKVILLLLFTFDFAIRWGFVYNCLCGLIRSDYLSCSFLVF